MKKYAFLFLVMMGVYSVGSAFAQPILKYQIECKDVEMTDENGFVLNQYGDDILLVAVNDSTTTFTSSRLEKTWTFGGICQYTMQETCPPSGPDMTFVSFSFQDANQSVMYSRTHRPEKMYPEIRIQCENDTSYTFCVVTCEFYDKEDKQYMHTEIPVFSTFDEDVLLKRICQDIGYRFSTDYALEQMHEDFLKLHKINAWYTPVNKINKTE